MLKNNPKKTSKNDKALQGEATRSQILEISKQLFGTNGYAQTSLEDILGELKLTKGALYYHFRNKREIFYEVCKSMNREASLGLEEVSWKEFKKNVGTIWDLAEDPLFVQIWIRDCYSVLTTDEIFTLDNLYVVAPIQRFIERMVREKAIQPLPTSEEAHLWIGMINQGLWLISNSPKKEKNKTKKNLTKVFLTFLEKREV